MGAKQCVVSFADSAGSYRKKLQRLEQSLKGNFDGDFLGFTDYKQIGSPRHDEIPYAFKPYAIQKAIDLGYEQILWCDSPLWAVKSIQPVFDYIEKEGYVFFDNIGHPLGMWCNDRTLKNFGIDREESFHVRQIMACCMGMAANHGDKYKYRGKIEPKDIFSDYKGNRAFYIGEWENDELTESQDRRVRGHRHDQAVMSCVLHTNNVPILKGQDTFFAYYAHREVMEISDSVCLYSG
jgi:hypothetical protein